MDQVFVEAFLHIKKVFLKKRKDNIFNPYFD